MFQVLQETYNIIRKLLIVKDDKAIYNSYEGVDIFVVEEMDITVVYLNDERINVRICYVYEVVQKIHKKVLFKVAVLGNEGNNKSKTILDGLKDIDLLTVNNVREGEKTIDKIVLNRH